MLEARGLLLGPGDRSVVAVTISPEALATSSAAVLMSAMVFERRSAVVLALSFSAANAPWYSAAMRDVATALAFRSVARAGCKAFAARETPAAELLHRRSDRYCSATTGTDG